MHRVKQWLASRGHALVLEDDIECAIDPEIKIVSVDTALSRDERLAVALHECGHLLIRECRERRPKKRVAGATLRECDMNEGRCKKRTKSGDIATLHEEIEAWERGLRLGRRLSLRFSFKKFERMRCRCLATYAYVGQP